MREREGERKRKRQRERQRERRKHRHGPQTLMLLREPLSRSQSVACAEVQAGAFKALPGSAAALVSVVIAFAFIFVLTSLFHMRILVVFCFLVPVFMTLFVFIMIRSILLCTVRSSFSCSRVVAHVSDPHIVAGDATDWKSLILFSCLLHFLKLQGVS